ncbi:D-glycero-beta-D-manno-heptose-7-phosphate kinase [uncultured Phascolarctobacterium sp.]|uniref:D-glycero-beta-D-manno-heptose-7-phosphate kinase n=1 Tax=uncultured Phascolarctobacterium sp. TaxID=512296 RepID=UPI0025E59228|nr:D-glycero-beta-D-manno-heptose-7-phosphate kinase [uncultured Phascolarctobacterium sp.]
MVNRVAGLAVTTFLAEQIKKLKIAVIGDVMLDRYFHGEVKRISPEAPVPVTKINRIKSVLGGATNVAANLAHLECQVFMGGVTGDDDNRVLLERLMADAGIDYSGLVKSERRKTITKLRVLGGNQQMLRLDFEETGDLYPEEIVALRQWLAGLLDDGLDGIIVSDYAKGVCSDDFCQWVINEGHAYNIPVLIDPKGADWTKYSGCDFITPNLKEMCEAAGCQKDNEDAAVVGKGRAAKDKYYIKNVVVTRSERGMSLINDHEVLHSPATAIEVFDVSGAGDTVAATLLAGAAGKLPLKDAIYMANRAAGIVVAKVGTYPVHRDELLKDLLTEERKQGRGYRTLSWQEIASLAATWKACGEKIVFTNGCFDILHVGHVTYLEKARNLGKHLIVGLNTDASVRRLKGETRPLVHELDRARVLAALACVDAVVLFDQDTPTELIEKIRPDILVKGGDYKPEEVAGREYAGEVRIIEFEDGYSTTGVVEKIAKMVKEGKL